MYKKTYNSAALARQLKKQEADRKSQKQARERTKSRIKHLENMVEILRQDESEARIVSLLHQLDQVTKEKDNLLQVLGSLDSTIRRQLGNHTGSNPASDTTSGLSTHASTREPQLPEWGKRTVSVNGTRELSGICSPTMLESSTGSQPSSLFAYDSWTSTVSNEPYPTAMVFDNPICPPNVDQLWQFSMLPENESGISVATQSF
ncbi:uncharacterized protein FMAN_15473 [Fusarium mangiferae]|uniref:BZIP domain-containing protein n=1 Tax=Fusarium mangiferae TaxID=192010 RepID=A0A1L7UMJ2_FUSMA|nr:uncharacterized protein FMAN_15473 [Fusarium mangiferae]CVL09305.1 uncharacterized protein FMAN_15473 [Fusarium mangiferae]